jgi:uncharacterized protein
VRGHSVGGIRRSTPDDPADPAWVNYVTVADVDAAVDAVTASGGSVVIPPSAVGDVGRMAMIEAPGVGRMLAMEYRHPFA